MNEYKPIEAYGLIGNLETGALVGNDGAIDWCCFPYLDSPSIFAAILDWEKGGTFSVRPVAPYESSQQYLHRTNVLQTAFHTASGTLTVTDFMPVRLDELASEYPTRAIYRRVACTEGPVDVDVEFAPRFDYARANTRLEPTSGGITAESDDESVFLSTPRELHIDGDTARATYVLEEGESHWYVAQYGSHDPMSQSTCQRLLDETVEYWRDWAHVCDDGSCLFGKATGDGTIGHDLAVRSGLVLKLLTRQDTGGICAAPTASLPEDVGGVRNWDYRFAWIRDGAFTIRALGELGHTDEAKAYLNRFLELSKELRPEEIRPLYGMERGKELEEVELDHLSGYRDSKPVRIGNDAAGQDQLDVYGELILAISQLTSADEEIVETDWNAVVQLADYICDNWEKTDSGIWEVRGGEQQFVYSKVMCWVGVDRAIELAEYNGFDAPVDEWKECREAIKETTIERGYDEDRGTFTQKFDDEDGTLDATALLIPLSGFLPFDDERVQNTINAVLERLTTDDGLVFRYDEGGDALPGDEGAFVLCSFWLVDCLALSDRIDEAQEIFDSVLDHASPLGLLSEEIDPETGQLLGNYPQAFSHIGLINSALYLAEAKEDLDAIEPFDTDR